jgi:hypothetical protein
MGAAYTQRAGAPFLPRAEVRGLLAENDKLPVTCALVDADHQSGLASECPASQADAVPDRSGTGLSATCACILKVQRKVFGCFRSDSGAAAFARLPLHASEAGPRAPHSVGNLFSGQLLYPAFARRVTNKREPRRFLIKLKSFSMKGQTREVALNTSHNLAFETRLREYGMIAEGLCARAHRTARASSLCRCQ